MILVTMVSLCKNLEEYFEPTKKKTLTSISYNALRTDTPHDFGLATLQENTLLSK